MTKDNERWLTDGFCPACRRFKYCKKSCRAQRERKRAILEKMHEKHKGEGNDDTGRAEQTV